MIRPFSLGSLLGLLVLTGCPEPKKPRDPVPSGRCEVDLARTGLFSAVGSGASAKVIEAPADLIGGPHAHGEVGDLLLSNDKVRVVIQRPVRQLGPLPYGGAIIDADRKRPDGQGGNDQLGKVGLFYGFGRTVNATQVEILEDGSRGGPAVVAASGSDALNDYLNMGSTLAQHLGPVSLAVDPTQPLPLLVTTYYVLSPGESRVRMLTAFCNQGREPVVTVVGDLLERGAAAEFFNPSGCVSGMGARDCRIDASPWFGFQGDDVAYGFRSYTVGDPGTPESSNALMSIRGAVGVLASASDVQGVLTWTNPHAPQRAGAFGIDGESQRLYLRDFLIGRELGEFRSFVTQQEQSPRGRLQATVIRDDGTPAPGARVSVVAATTGKPVVTLVADEAGRARVDLPATAYRLSAAALGATILPPLEVSVATSGTTEATLKLGPSRKLTIQARDPYLRPLPAKVTVFCPGGPCAQQSTAWVPFFETELLPSNVAAITFIPPQGTATVELPPGQYQVLVTRGPEYSAWPSTWPNKAEAVDLSTADQSLTAVLARVVDSSGWLSADLRVRASHSSDSSVDNAMRVLSLAAEGVEILVSADHEVATDYRPLVASLGASEFIVSVVGAGLSPFDFGHHQAFPIQPASGTHGGGFDWAGGDGPTLRPEQIFGALRQNSPEVVIQMNHPRDAASGALTLLKVDTATGASHADPARFRMEPKEGASSADTQLFSEDFDTIEVQSGLSAAPAALNDWMTFLSRGLVKTATASSNAYGLFSTSGGSSRTLVKLTKDAPPSFDAAEFSRALKSQRAIGTNGPFLRVHAQKIDANGQPSGAAVDVGETLSLNASAGEKVELSVQVQAPEWLTFDVIELYTHASGREAVDGVPNASWPSARIHQSRALDPATLPLVPVPDTNGMSFRRIQVEEKFVLSPTMDTWYVVLVRGGAQSASLFPLVMSGVQCSGALCMPNETKAHAFSNAILIDADSSGSYDKPPLK